MYKFVHMCNALSRFMDRFDRDWKKIEDFVGSKTVIQVKNYQSNELYALNIQLKQVILFADSKSRSKVLSKGPEKRIHCSRPTTSP